METWILTTRDLGRKEKEREDLRNKHYQLQNLNIIKCVLIYGN
jgi:hypothetical protein